MSPENNRLEGFDVPRLEALLQKFEDEKERGRVIYHIRFQFCVREGDSEQITSLKNAFLDLADKAYPHTLDVINRVSGYSAQTDLQRYTLLKENMDFFKAFSGAKIGHSVDCCDRSLRIRESPLDQEGLTAFRNTLAYLRENHEWLNSLEDEKALYIFLRIGSIFSQVKDPAKSKVAAQLLKKGDQKILDFPYDDYIDLNQCPLEMLEQRLYSSHE